MILIFSTHLAPNRVGWIMDAKVFDVVKEKRVDQE